MAGGNGNVTISPSWFGVLAQVDDEDVSADVDDETPAETDLNVLPIVKNVGTAETVSGVVEVVDTAESDLGDDDDVDPAEKDPKASSAVEKIETEESSLYQKLNTRKKGSTDEVGSRPLLPRASKLSRRPLVDSSALNTKNINSSFQGKRVPKKRN